MNLEIYFVPVFLLGASIQGFFLFIVLLLRGRSQNQASYLWLSALIALFTFYLFKAGISSAGLISKAPDLVVTGFLVIPAIAPLCFLYLASIIGLRLSIRSYLVHGGFFLIQTIYWAPFYLQSASWKFGVLSGEILAPAYSNEVGLWFELAQVVQHLIYVFLIWNLIKKRADRPGVNLDWIKKVAIFFVIYASMFALGTLSFRFLEVSMPDYLFYSVIATSIYLIGYYGYLQRDFLHEIQVGEKPKYLFTNIDSKESAELYNLLSTLMTQENMFLRKGIKIYDLAKKLDRPVNHVSRAINENFGGSFTDLVNNLRVQKAKTFLSDAKNNDKLFAVALNSGFSNKVSFYKNFKNIVGKSPAEFRDQVRQNIS